MNEPENDIYDVVIIGAGPAGLSAGLYAGRANLKTVILEKGLPGGTVLLTWKVDNYPGFAGGSGMDLMAVIEKQARENGCEIVREEVTDLKLGPKIKEVITTDTTRRSKNVIIATGARPHFLGIPGEKEFVGRGVSYCATCDGAFFKGVPVAVIGGGDTAVEEASFLTRFASKVYLVHRRGTLRAVKGLQDELLSHDNVSVIWDTVVDEVYGEQVVNGLGLRNVKTGEKKRLDVEGVFIFVGITPNSELVKDNLEMDQWGFVKSDEMGRTTIPGVYAVGDIRSKEMRQIANAVGEGAGAAYILEKSLRKY